MWLEAIVPREDWATLLSELAPVTIRLGESGELCIHEPSSVTLVEDVGLRVECQARLEWEVLGLEVPVTVSAAVLVRPRIAQRDGRSSLVFALELERSHVSGVPPVLDARVTDLVNRELESKGVEVTWPYGDTLDYVFDLPTALRPRERLALTVDGAKVKATRDAIGVAIQMRAAVTRGAVATVVPRLSHQPAMPAPEREGNPGRGRVAMFCGLAALALGGAYAIGRAR